MLLFPLIRNEPSCVSEYLIDGVPTRYGVQILMTPGMLVITKNVHEPGYMWILDSGNPRNAMTYVLIRNQNLESQEFSKLIIVRLYFEELTLLSFEIFVETIRNRVREHSIQQIRKAMDHVVQLQENHPGTVTSIKTRQTINFLLKTTEKSIDKLRSSGFLDSEEFVALKTSLKKQKGQVRIPSTIVAPKSIDALRKCLWLFESEKINENQRRIIVENLRSIEIKNFSWKDFLWRKEQSSNGVFLIVYGLVEEWRLYPYDIDAATLENRRKNNFRSSDELFTEENRTKTIGSSFSKSWKFSLKFLVENPMVDMSSLQDGFYARWNRIVSANLEPIERSNSEHFGLEDFDENFENFSFSHPTSSSDKIHRCFSFSENETVGFYDFLVNRTDKYRSTVKSLTNSTTFFIEKEKLVEIFDRFDLWKIVWLEFGKTSNRIERKTFYDLKTFFSNRFIFDDFLREISSRNWTSFEFSFVGFEWRSNWIESRPRHFPRFGLVEKFIEQSNLWSADLCRSFSFKRQIRNHRNSVDDQNFTFSECRSEPDRSRSFHWQKVNEMLDR